MGKRKQANKQTNWNNIIFSDESTFQLFSNKRKVCRRVGQIVKVFKMKHAAKVHVWGCFSASGFGRLCIFKSNLNVDKLCDIYKRYLLLSAKKLVDLDKESWIFQEDNDPKHK